jgi:hypothetical protein
MIPFFFFSGRWKSFWQSARSLDLTGDTLNTGAQFLLLALLIASAVAVGLFLFLPLLLFRSFFWRSRSSRNLSFSSASRFIR